MKKFELKRLSVYHMAKERWNRKYNKPVVLDFLMGICKDREMDEAVQFTCMVIANIATYFFALSFWGWILTYIGLSGIYTTSFAALDTYNTYKYRIRQDVIKSIYKVMGVELDIFGNPRK